MYLDAAPGSFLGKKKKKNCVKAVCTCILSRQGNKKACGAVGPGPPHPHVTQEIHLVLWVKRDLMRVQVSQTHPRLPPSRQILMYGLSATELSPHRQVL